MDRGWRSRFQAMLTSDKILFKHHFRNRNEVQMHSILKEAIKKIDSSVKNLMDLNRPQSENKQRVEVDDVIRKASNLFKEQLKYHGIILKLNLNVDNVYIQASPLQLSQVVINLMNNSVGALTDPSFAEKISRQHPDYKKTITITSERKDNEIVITITDNGPGISNECIEDIFSPYFSSKKKVGLGVGLSICQNILKDHQGSISASNRTENGVAFTIVLPTGHNVLRVP